MRRNGYIIILLLAVGFFLRWVHLEKTAVFNADQENFAWKAVEIAREHKFTLIGMKAGEFPVFIGPLMYYVFALVYLVFGFDPVGINYFNLLMSLITMGSIFYVGAKVFNTSVGFLALWLYAFSYFFIAWDRNSWLPTLLPLISVWIFYTLLQIGKSSQTKWWIMLGILLAVSFQLHFSALLYWPIAGLLLMVNKKFATARNLLVGLGISFLGFLPVVIFDLRHDWLNLRGVWGLLAHAGSATAMFPRLGMMLRITTENFAHILSLPKNFGVFLILTVLLAGGRAFWLMLIWLLVPVGIFTVATFSVPEYYFALTYPIIVYVFAVTLYALSQFPYGKYVVYSLMPIFVFLQLDIFGRENVDKVMSMHYKKQVVEYVIEQSNGEMPKINYLADLSHNFGFDYLFYWKLGQKIESTTNPQFTIVVPWDFEKLPITKRFGAIGLIEHKSNR